MTSDSRITIDSQICHGKPCIRGFRYPVTMILELLASGMSHDDILADYEDLLEENIRACLQFAAKPTVRSSQPLSKPKPGTVPATPQVKTAR